MLFRSVEAAERLEKILRRDATVPVVMGHAPIEARAVESEGAEAAGGGGEDAHGGVDDLRPDAIAGVEGNAVDFQAAQTYGGFGSARNSGADGVRKTVASLLCFFRRVGRSPRLGA